MAAVAHHSIAGWKVEKGAPVIARHPSPFDAKCHFAPEPHNTAGLWSEPGVSAGVIDGAKLRSTYLPLLLRGK
jgi:hypothetical protein